MLLSRHMRKAKEYTDLECLKNKEFGNNENI